MDPTSSPIFKKQLSQISLSPAPKSISQPRDGANSVEGVGGGEGRGGGEEKEEEEKEEQEEEEEEGQVWPVSEDRPSSPSFTTWVGQAMAMKAVRSKVSVFFPRGSS